MHGRCFVALLPSMGNAELHAVPKALLSVSFEHKVWQQSLVWLRPEFHLPRMAPSPSPKWHRRRRQRRLQIFWRNLVLYELAELVRSFRDGWIPKKRANVLRAIENCWYGWPRPQLQLQSPAVIDSAYLSHRSSTTMQVVALRIPVHNLSR